jgi:hypothetical protein
MASWRIDVKTQPAVRTNYEHRTFLHAWLALVHYFWAFVVYSTILSWCLCTHGQ